MQLLNVVWLRNDLRYFDNAALSSAVEDAARTGAAVLALFIATPQTWQKHDMAPIKQDLIRRRVLQLQLEMKLLNIPLMAVEGSSYQQVTGVFTRLSQQFQLKVFVPLLDLLRLLQAKAIDSDSVWAKRYRLSDKRFQKLKFLKQIKLKKNHIFINILFNSN